LPFPIFTDNNRVGIGKPTPTSDLDVVGDVAISGTLTVAGGAVGAISIGAFGSTPNSGGASIAGGVITLQPASVTQPGGVSIAAQTFNGAKTFDDGVLTNSVTSASAATLALASSVANGASAIAATVNSSVALSTSGAKLLSVQNNSIEKVYITKDGDITSGAANFTITGSVATGATSATKAIILNSASTLTSAARVLSVQNNTVEGFYVTADGSATANATLSSTVRVFAPYFGNNNTSLPVEIHSFVADGGAAVAGYVRTDAAWTTAGAKLWSFRNNNTEKAFVDKDGNVEVTTVGAGFILKSPDGTRYKIVVADGGALSATAA